MIAIRSVATSVLALALVAPAVAQSFDGVWEGDLHCETIPQVTSGPLRGKFTLTVEGTTARYERHILNPDSNVPSGNVESGGGTVAPDGAVRLEGRASGRRWSLTANYSGRLEERRARLTGTQDWWFEGRGGTFARKCTLALAR